LTSKQSTLLGFIGRELIHKGHTVLYTCRRYEFTEGAFKRLGIQPKVIGSYAEGDSFAKVKADIERMHELLELIKKEDPDVLLSYPNPSAARVAFGVGIPYMAITDSPHSVIPSRLSLSVADYVIFSNCIPASEVKEFVYRKSTLLVPYNGVDEVSWILRSRPSLDYVRSLGLREWRYVVIRPHERMATYYRDLKPKVDFVQLVQALDGKGLTTVFIPRYKEHYEVAKELLKKGLKVKVIQNMYDGVSLNYYALTTITGGATLAREAALLMTPGITLFPKNLYVNSCVKKKGYPLFRANSIDDIMDVIEATAKEKKPSFEKVLRRISNDFEDLIPVVVKIVEAIRQ